MLYNVKTFCKTSFYSNQFSLFPWYNLSQILLSLQLGAASDRFLTIVREQESFVSWLGRGF